MSVVDLRLGGAWHVPDDVDPRRGLVLCGEADLGREVAFAATAPARSSVLFLELEPHGAVATAAGVIKRLLRDGCDAEQLAILGVGRHATTALAACVVLRSELHRAPAVAASAHGGHVVVLRPACTPTDLVASHLAASAASFDPRDDHWAAAGRAAAGIDLLLAANSS